MKSYSTNLLLLLLLLFSYSNAISQTPPPGNSLVGVFDGRTPCRELAKQFDEKTSDACIKIKWRLILYKDSITGNPSVYQLLGLVYRKENPRVGNWKIVKGTQTNPDAIVYQLDFPGKESILLLKADDNVLFFLDKQKHLMVGNRDFSYTLNRKLTPMNQSK